MRVNDAHARERGGFRRVGVPERRGRGGVVVRAMCATTRSGNGKRDMNIPGVGTACGVYVQGRVTPPAEKRSTMHRGVAI